MMSVNMYHSFIYKEIIPSHQVSNVWELVGIDLTGPLPKTVNGNIYILTATDYFSKWVEAFPLKTKSAAEVGQHLCSMIYRHGCPKRILSDQGREFVNQVGVLQKQHSSRNDIRVMLLPSFCFKHASFYSSTMGFVRFWEQKGV